MKTLRLILLLALIAGSAFGASIPYQLLYTNHFRTNGTWRVSSVNPYVDVRDFGAVGNGVTDDLASFNSALAYAVSRNFNVIVRRGRYYLSGEINALTNPITLKGESGDRTGSVLIGPNTSTRALMIATNNITIEGLCFTNWGSTIQWTNAAGLTNVAILNCMFENVSLAGKAGNNDHPIYDWDIIGNKCWNITGAGDGFDVCSRIWNSVRIRDTRFLNLQATDGTGAIAIRLGDNSVVTGDAYWFPTNNINGWIEDNWMKNIHGQGETHGILVYGWMVNDSGNHIYEVDTTSGDCEAIYHKTTHSVISGNVIFNGGGTNEGGGGAITLKGSDWLDMTNDWSFPYTNSGASRGFNTTVRGNFIYDDRPSVTAGGSATRGIAVFVGDIDISDNLIQGVTGDSIYFDPAFQARCRVINNKIFAFRGQQAVMIRNSTADLEFIRNTLHFAQRGGSTVTGFRIYNTGVGTTISGLLFEGNELKDLYSAAWPAPTIYGWLFDPNGGAITNTTIRNNTTRISGAGSAGFVQASDKASVYNTLFENNRHEANGWHVNFRTTPGIVIRDNGTNDIGNTLTIRPASATQVPLTFLGLTSGSSETNMIEEWQGDRSRIFFHVNSNLSWIWKTYGPVTNLIVQTNDITTGGLVGVGKIPSTGIALDVAGPVRHSSYLEIGSSSYYSWGTSRAQMRPGGGDGRIKLTDSGNGGLFYLLTFGNEDAAHTSISNGTAGLTLTSGTAGHQTNWLAKSFIASGTLVLTPSSTVNLTADDQVVTVLSLGNIPLSSDNGVSTAITFVLTQGVQAGHILILEWTGTNAGELVDDFAVSGGGNGRLSATWTPTQYDTLSLIWNGTDWIETGRSAN